MVTALIAAALLMAHSTAFQASPPAKPPEPNTVSPVVLISPQKDKQPKGPDAVVCRNEPVLGSRMAVKRCSTVEQMAMDRFEAQQDLAKAQAKDGYHH